MYNPIPLTKCIKCTFGVNDALRMCITESYNYDVLQMNTWKCSNHQILAHLPFFFFLLLLFFNYYYYFNLFICI